MLAEIRLKKYKSSDQLLRAVQTVKLCKMKVLLALSALLGLAAATTKCEDCTNIVTAIRDHLTSEESMNGQVINEKKNRL